MVLPKLTLSVSEYEELIRSNCHVFLGDSVGIDIVTEYAESSGWTAYVPVPRTDRQQRIISAKAGNIPEAIENLHKASAEKVRMHNQSFFPNAQQQGDKKRRKHPGGRTSHTMSDSEEEEVFSSDDEGENPTPHTSPDLTATNQLFIPLPQPPRNPGPLLQPSMAHMMQQHTLTTQKPKWSSVKFAVLFIIKSKMLRTPIKCLCDTTLGYTEILAEAHRIVARECPKLPISHDMRIESVKADDEEYSIMNGTRDLLRLPNILKSETLQVVVSC